MAGHTYVTNGYSNYPDVLPQEGGYVYGPNQHANWYTVETTTVERFHVPPNGYNNFGGAPLRNDYRKGYMPKYAPQGHHEIYELNYGLDNAKSSPPRYHERENLMDDFINILQIGASRPTKTGNLLGPNKYRPSSPKRYRPKSPTYGYPSREPHFIQAQYLPAPNRYRPISPTKYRPTSPTKYNPTSPTNNQTTSRIDHGPTSPTKYSPTSPTKYQTKSPTKYQPANMTEFQHPNQSKYEPTSPSPTDIYPSKENHMFTAQNLQDPNNNQPTNPVHNVPSREIKPIRIQSISDPNKFLPSSPRHDDRNVKADDFSGPKNHWQTASLPAPHKSLTTPTNDINEALGSLIESANNSPRAQPVKSDNRFGWNALGSTARRFMKSDTIDSKEAIKKYNGAHVP